MINLTNREVVSRALDHLHRGILPLVERRMDAPTNDEGSDATTDVPSDEKQDEKREQYSRDDIRSLLSAVVEHPEAFKGDLTNEQVSLASDVRDITSTVHHQRDIPNDEAAQILDQVERFLRGIGHGRRAITVADLRLELEEAHGQRPTSPGRPRPATPAPSAPTRELDMVSVAALIASLACCGVLGLPLGMIGMARTSEGKREGGWAAGLAVLIGAISTLGIIVVVSSGSLPEQP